MMYSKHVSDNVIHFGKKMKLIFHAIFQELYFAQFLSLKTVYKTVK